MEGVDEAGDFCFGGAVGEADEAGVVGDREEADAGWGGEGGGAEGEGEEEFHGG